LKITDLAHQIVQTLARRFRPLFIYHLFFSILVFILLAPLTAWLSTKILSTTGHPLVSHQEMVSFFLSPAGLFWLLAAESLALLLMFLHHSGMIIIADQAGKRPFHPATDALWQVGRRLPDLLALSVIQVGAHLLLASPFLLAMGLLWKILLGNYDPYFLISRTPSIFWIYAAVISPLAAGMLICNGMLYLRWFLALPVLILEKKSPRTALKRGASISRGHLKKMAVLVLGLALTVILLPVLLTLLFDGLGGLVLGWLPENFAILIPAVILYISAYIIMAILISFAGITSNSLLIYQLYRTTSGLSSVKVEYAPRRTGILAWGAEILLLIFALVQAGIIMHSFFDFQDHVYISAHRGSSMKAPENTIPAIEQAIIDGADYVEIDVRQTADGVPVLLHDRDLRRIAGRPEAIWELTLNEVRRLDAGSWFHPGFSGVGIPTLEEAIEVVRGRAGLYLEIKPSPHTPDLARNVVRVLQENEYIEDVLIGAMQSDILREVRSLEPRLRTSLLIHTFIGEPDRELVDALGLRAAITGTHDVREARRHGHELHVWTVNDRREMSRFIDMGVDNIITDVPDVLADLLEERTELSNAQLLLVKLRHWLRD